MKQRLSSGSLGGVGLDYPRERARIRGANRRGLVAIRRDEFGEATFVAVTAGKTYDEIRSERAIFRERGAWQSRWWQGEGKDADACD